MDDHHHRHNHPSLLFLTKGFQVEVTSAEDGFNGAWYVATVIHPPPSTRNSLVYVEYHNLLAEDGSSSRLREYANIAYVRPSPPPDTNPPNFQLNDLVDAFYSDGWRTGVITTVIDASNFVVTFQNSPEQIQFHCSDLRIHRKWVGGRWFQPQKQGTAGLMFTVGKRVEVSFERESLRDCWLPATILKNSDNNTFLVEYQQPGTGDKPILHKVTVDCLHIRPSPPHLRDKNFFLLEKVDAYYDFGWWSGVITKELADNRYNVFFKNTKKEREFDYSKVRPHMEWKGGKWFNSSQALLSPILSSERCKSTIFNLICFQKKEGDTDGRTTHSLIDVQTEQTTPSINKQSLVAPSLMKKTRREDLDSNYKGSPPSKKPQDAFMNDDLSKRTNRRSVGQSEGFDSEVSGVTDQPFGKIENISDRKKVRIKLGKGVEVKTLTIDSSRKKGKFTNELKSLQASDEGSKVDSIKTETQEVGKKDTTKDLDLPVVMDLQCNVITVLEGKMLQKRSIKKTPKVKESDTQRPGGPFSPLTVGEKEETVSVAPKRKRGRPPKTTVTINNQNRGVAPSAPSVVEGGQNKEVGLTTSLPTKSLEANQGPVKEQPGIQNATLGKDKVPNENTGQNLDGQPGQKEKKYSTKKGKRGKQRTISLNTESPAQVFDVDSQDSSKEKPDGSLEKDSATRNLEASVGKSVDAVFDDQPLSSCFKGKNLPTTVHGPGTVEQSSKASDMDAEDLPFVRSTPLWKTIELMAAFRMLPQNPHFGPLLEGVKESAREGLAIGSMVTFTTVVDKSRGLRFDDPRSTIEDCLETLVELENNGFDVEVIRERLTRLLLIKDKQEELAERSKQVVEKIKGHNVQGKRNDEEIEEIDRQIRELEEKRKQVVLKKEKWSSEIGVLIAMNEENEQKMRVVGAEFDGLAAAPLLSI